MPLTEHSLWQKAIRSAVVSARSIAKVCCGLLVFFLAGGCDLTGKKSLTQPSLTREERLKFARESYAKEQCKKQWAVLWPLAREGDGEALSELAYELELGLKMPATDSDMKGDAHDANVTVIAIYGAAKHPDGKSNLNYIFDPARWNKDDVTVVSMRSGSIIYSSINPPPPAPMTKLKNCLFQANSSAAGDLCVAQAIELGLIPSFREYSKAMDAVLATYRAESCTPRPW
ncbi:hypothetical protein NKH47_13440 [Mesorhizobium sp. M1060]|uniref:hypothetical protein n=1 Tax=unclassified Mesorhizobium TaxID=325217 RepID=UPI0012EB26AE|nr:MULTISPECIES: hypothetical protein [unclassified Mesorhizobium]WJI48582.1 hypothetical protein NLY44_17945 [Mesorhizobium sp. C089B]